jgi:hypothetical protein
MQGVLATGSPLGARTRREALTFWVLLLILAVVGVLLMLRITRWGIGLWEDTFDYFTAAQSLAAGYGLGRWDGYGNFRPMTHFPPGYPMVLALLKLLGMDLLVGARWLSCSLFGMTVLLAGVAVLDATSSATFGLMGAGLVLTSEAMIGVYGWALSEPLYLLLGVVALLLLARHLQEPRQLNLLVASGLATAFACMTRYVGLSLVVGGTVGILIGVQRPIRVRLERALLYLAVSLAPIGLFIARNAYLAGNVSDRPSPAWHPPNYERWQASVTTILKWGLPDSLVERLEGTGGFIVLAVLAGIAVLVTVWLMREMRLSKRVSAGGASALDLLLASYIVAYSVIILISTLFLDRMTLLDNRILSPLYLNGFLLLVRLVWQLWTGPGYARRVVGGILCAALLVLNLYRVQGLVRVLPQDGRGFASRTWRQSETILYTRTLPVTTIYSNEIQAIYFLTGRTAVFIPTGLNPAANAERSDYETSLENMHRRLANQGGVVVIFHPGGVDRAEFQDITEGLMLLGTFFDGVVYGRSVTAGP